MAKVQNTPATGSEDLAAQVAALKAEVAAKDATIAELMAKVSELDATPKAKADTVKVGKVTYKLTAAKSYVRKPSDNTMALATAETIAADSELFEAAVKAGILIEA